MLPKMGDGEESRRSGIGDVLHPWPSGFFKCCKVNSLISDHSASVESSTNRVTYAFTYRDAQPVDWASQSIQHACNRMISISATVFGGDMYWAMSSYEYKNCDATYHGKSRGVGVNDVVISAPDESRQLGYPRSLATRPKQWYDIDSSTREIGHEIIPARVGVSAINVHPREVEVLGQVTENSLGAASAQRLNDPKNSDFVVHEHLNPR